MILSNPTLHRVCKAVSTDVTRYFMNNLHVEADWCIATDGRRLHGCRNVFDLAPGAYRVEKNIKSKQVLVLIPDIDAGTFPDWRRVMPTTFARSIAWRITKDTDAGSIIDMHSLAPLSHRYLLDLSPGRYVVGLPEPQDGVIDKSVLFADCDSDFFAVLTPMKTGATLGEPEKSDTDRLTLTATLNPGQ